MSKAAFILLAVILMAAPHMAQAEDYCAEAKTTPEINACMEEEYNATAEKLKSELAALRAYAVETDDDSNGSYEVAKKFDAAQVAFLAYLEAACEYEASTYTSGTGASAAYSGCKTALTKQRLERLKYLNP